MREGGHWAVDYDLQAQLVFDHPAQSEWVRLSIRYESPWKSPEPPKETGFWAARDQQPLVLMQDGGYRLAKGQRRPWFSEGQLFLGSIVMGDAMGRNGALYAGRRARRADQRAKVHQSLIEL